MCLIKKICVLAMNSSTIFSSIFAHELNQYICNVFIRICLKIQKMLSTRVNPIQTSLVAIGIHGPSVLRYRGTMLVTGPDTSQVSWRAPLWQEIKKSKLLFFRCSDIWDQNHIVHYSLQSKKRGISANGASPDTAVLMRMMHSNEVVPTVGYITTSQPRKPGLDV